MTVDESTYMPIGGFTTVDLGCERGNNSYYLVQKTESYENAGRFIRAGVRTKVLMLSATPVNSKFIDPKNQLALAYEGDAEQINKKLATTKSVDEIFRQAQKAFFELLDSVTIARSRKHIEKYYNTANIGKFPERLSPISLRPCLTDLSNAINYNDIYSLLMSLYLSIYTPSNYIMPSQLTKYLDMSHHKGTSLTQAGQSDLRRRGNG